MDEISKLFGFKHITTSVAYPQTNGSVDRAHARLNEYLRSIGKNLENDKNWDVHMKYVGFCYNTIVHSILHDLHLTKCYLVEKQIDLVKLIMKLLKPLTTILKN